MGWAGLVVNLPVCNLVVLRALYTCECFLLEVIASDLHNLLFEDGGYLVSHNLLSEDGGFSGSPQLV